MKSWIKGGLIGCLLFLVYRLYLLIIGKCFFVTKMLMVTGGVTPCIHYWNITITLIVAIMFFILGALIGLLIGRIKK